MGGGRQTSFIISLDFKLGRRILTGFIKGFGRCSSPEVLQAYLCQATREGGPRGDPVEVVEAAVQRSLHTRGPPGGAAHGRVLRLRHHQPRQRRGLRSDTRTEDGGSQVSGPGGAQED